MKVKRHVFHGPNLIADYAGIFLEFTPPYDQSLPLKDVNLLWTPLFKDNHNLKINELQNGEIEFTQCCSLILSQIYNPASLQPQKVVSYGIINISKSSFIYLRYLRIEPANLAIKLALEISNDIFRSIIQKTPSLLEHDSINKIYKSIKFMDTQNDVKTLIQVALAKNIPFYPTTESFSRFCHLGQGSKAQFTLLTANQNDSFLGRDLAHNKDWANDFIRKIGFPCVHHILTQNFEQAIIAAEKIGFPIVIKPVAGSMGYGVTTGINNLNELKNAFSKAIKFPGRGVLIEKQVEGIDHRIMIYAGKLLWVSAKFPAHVISDGKKNIKELITQENARRSISDNSKKSIPFNEETTQILKQQGFTLNDAPKKGLKIMLRTVANLEMGGIREDVTHRIHPDNRIMAETIARQFHMDVIGLDYIIEDISKSWKDHPSAIIEVNQTPGFSVDWQAEKIMEQLFPNGNDGRIPTILILGIDTKLINKIEKIFSKAGLALGLVTPNQTTLHQYDRGKPSDSIQTRVYSLITDPTCDALLISIFENYITEKGLPLDQFDLVITLDQIDSKVLDLIKSHTHKLISKQNAQNFEGRLERLLHKLIPK